MSCSYVHVCVCQITIHKLNFYHFHRIVFSSDHNYEQLSLSFMYVSATVCETLHINDYTQLQ